MAQSETPLPSWLSCTLPVVHSSAHRPDIIKSLTITTFDNIMENALDKISQGISLMDVLRADARDIDYSQFLRWIHSSPERKGRYHEAQEIGAEVIASEMIRIADGEDSGEDVQRSRLRIDTRKFLVGVWSKRYREKGPGEVAVNVNVTQGAAGLTDAQLASIITTQHPVIEGETE